MRRQIAALGIGIVRSKEIMPCHCLVVYGYDSAEPERVARQFIRAGYQDIQVYNDSINEWAQAGISPDKHNAFYCGTGWRGSEAFFNAWLMGWPRISVFDGGWFEWSNDNKNPYETGVPKRVLMGVG